jgi:hypothetical protein
LFSINGANLGLFSIFHFSSLGKKILAQLFVLGVTLASPQKRKSWGFPNLLDVGSSNISLAPAFFVFCACRSADPAFPPREGNNTEFGKSSNPVR